MIRSSFGAFTTARLALTASQKALDVTGNNIANLKTNGYTRQRIDQQSLYFGGSDRYSSQYDANVGRGVLVTGISQIRDPYLDRRFRTEIAEVGQYDEKLSGLEDLQTALDAVNKDSSIEKQLSNILEALQKLSTETTNKEFDSIVRSNSQVLCQLLNNASNQIDKLRKDAEYNIENIDVPQINTLLENIQDLNKTIKRNEIHGNPSLELKDQRNLMLDELASYLPIEVKYIPHQISNDIVVNELNVIFTTTSGKDYLLVDDDQVSEFILDPPKGTETDYTLRMKNLNEQKSIDDPAIGDIISIANSEFGSGTLKSSLNYLNSDGQFEANANAEKGLGYYQKMLDVLANTLATSFNGANKYPTGVDADGNIIYEDRPLFESDSTTNIIGKSNVDLDINSIVDGDSVKSGFTISLGDIKLDKSGKVTLKIGNQEITSDVSSKNKNYPTVIAGGFSGQTIELGGITYKVSAKGTDLKFTATTASNTSNFDGNGNDLETYLSGLNIDISAVDKENAAITLDPAIDPQIKDNSVLEGKSNCSSFEMDLGSNLVLSKAGSLQIQIGDQTLTSNEIAEADLSDPDAIASAFAGKSLVLENAAGEKIEYEVSVAGTKLTFTAKPPAVDTNDMTGYGKGLETYFANNPPMFTDNILNIAPSTSGVTESDGTANSSFKLDLDGFSLDAAGKVQLKIGDQTIEGDSVTDITNPEALAKAFDGKTVTLGTDPDTITYKISVNGSELTFAADGNTNTSGLPGGSLANFLQNNRPALAGGLADISAKTIKIAEGWASGEYGMTAIQDPNAPDGNNTNIMHFISMMENKVAFKKPGSDETLFTGTFNEYYTNLNSILGEDIKSTKAVLENHTTVAADVSAARDNVSAVSLDEEGMNILQYQKSFSAASRLATALDECLNTIINGMGLVGR